MAGQLFDEIAEKVLVEANVPLVRVTLETFVAPATFALAMAEEGVAEDAGDASALLVMLWKTLCPVSRCQPSMRPRVVYRWPRV